MSEEMQNKEAQKTVIAFIVGLVVGGLLVWVFSGTPAETPTESGEETNTTEETTNNDESEDESDNTDEDADTDNEDSESEPTTEETDDNDDQTSQMETGEGSVTVTDQPAGNEVELESAVFPNNEGWIGVRDYQNGQLGSLLGVVRFSKEQGLVPDSITLQRATEAGQTYAVVFYTESGDREFSLADDVQVGGVFAEFTAQ